MKNKKNYINYAFNNFPVKIASRLARIFSSSKEFRENGYVWAKKNNLEEISKADFVNLFIWKETSEKEKYWNIINTFYSSYHKEGILITKDHIRQMFYGEESFLDLIYSDLRSPIVRYVVVISQPETEED